MGETKIGDDSFNVVFDGPEDAPVLVLSNSLGTNLSMWDPQIPSLVRHFRVLRYDTRGHGGSSVGQPPYSIAQLGRDIIGILDAHGIEHAHFIGLSLGGMVGQWLLAHAPERIGRAVLANTCAHYSDPAPWNARIGAVRSGGLAAIVGGTLDRWFTPAFREAEPEIMEQIREMICANPAEGYLGCCAAIRDMDQRESLTRVTNDVLVIVGEHDMATPPEAGWAIVDRIPGSQLVTLEAAHLSNIEMDEGFTEAALKFLTAPVRRAAKPAAKITGKPSAPAPRRAARTAVARRSAVRQAAPRAAVAAGGKAVTAPAEAAASARTPARKSAAKKTAARKSAAKKAAAKKTAPRKSAAKKTAAKKSAARKSPAKKGAAKKGATKKAATKKAATKKAATKKGAARKGAPKKAAAKKGARKGAVKKTARKAAVKKTARKAGRKPRR